MSLEAARAKLEDLEARQRRHRWGRDYGLSDQVRRQRAEVARLAAAQASTDTSSDPFAGLGWETGRVYTRAEAATL